MNEHVAATANDQLDLEDAVRHIQTPTELADFLRKLHAEFQQNPDYWENRDLSSYLEAMAAWVADMEGFFKNSGESVPEQPSWKTLGQILLAARVYE